jgi:guanyl-specific ribonuclease Sa
VTTSNLTPSTPTTTSSSTQTTTPANSEFSSSTALQAPTSIVPQAISSISTASSVTAPNSSPIVGLPGSASSVTPPNASVPSSSTPTSSGVTPPSGSSPGTGTGVTPPSGGGVTVTPQGYYNAKGNCVASKTRDECDTTKDLEDKAAKLENDIDNGVGNAEQKRLELEMIRADLNLRDLYGNDRVADGHLERLVKSQLFSDSDFNTGMKIHMLQTMSKGIQEGTVGKKDIEALVRLTENFKLEMVNGKPTLVYSPKNGMYFASSVSPSTIAGLGIGLAGITMGGALAVIGSGVVATGVGAAAVAAAPWVALGIIGVAIGQITYDFFAHAVEDLKDGTKKDVVVPQKAKDSADAIAKTGQGLPGTAGGDGFANDGRNGTEKLPEEDENGNPITYDEYDVNPFTTKAERGQERVVYGSDGRAWYTNDHYEHFTPIPIKK